MSAYAVLIFLAAAFFLVVVAQATSLRRYATLFDGSPEPPSLDGSGLVQGRIGGRDATFSLTLPRRTRRQPGELRVSLGCSASLALSVERETLATGFQKAIGLLHDRASGDADLDRRFLFRFDDRAHLRTCLERTELKSALLSLADLGVDSIRVDRQCVTASIQLQLIFLPRRERVRDVLDQLLAAATAMESAAGGNPPVANSTPAAKAADDRSRNGPYWPAWTRGRSPRAALSTPLMIAIYFAAVVLAFWLGDPMWKIDAQTSWQAQLSQMEIRLSIATLVAGVIGLAAGRLVGENALICGIGLSWPMLFYTAYIWAYFLTFARPEFPVTRSFLASLGGAVTPVLTLLTAAPVLLLLSGWVGARLGRLGR